MNKAREDRLMAGKYYHRIKKRVSNVWYGKDHGKKVINSIVIE